MGWKIILLAGVVLLSGDLFAKKLDGKTVEAQLGGKTQPNKPGFVMSLKKVGKKSREVTVILDCQLFPDNTGDCGPVPPSVTVDTLTLGLRPYEEDCPRLLDGECPDVFTMAASTLGPSGVLIPEDMSFRINPWTENLFIEVASAIGGADSPNPGTYASPSRPYSIYDTI